MCYGSVTVDVAAAVSDEDDGVADLRPVATAWRQHLGARLLQRVSRVCATAALQEDSCVQDVARRLKPKDAQPLLTTCKPWSSRAKDSHVACFSGFYVDISCRLKEYTINM